MNENENRVKALPPKGGPAASIASRSGAGKGVRKPPDKQGGPAPTFHRSRPKRTSSTPHHCRRVSPLTQHGHTQQEATPASDGSDWPGRDLDHEHLRLLAEMPERYHPLLFAAWSGENPEAATKLHCLLCRGFDGNDSRPCAYPDCPNNN